MKTIQYLTLGVAVATLAACESNKKSTITESGTEVVKVRTPVSDTIQDEPMPESETKTVSGTVESINNGKDGYTANVKTADNEVFSVTISHSNLKDPAQYKTVKVGDKISVTGDYWKMGEDKQITVRSIN